VLITGAAGFMGRRLVGELEARQEVWALAHRGVPADRGVAHWAAADLTSPSFASSLPRRVDTVVHLAQSRYYREFPEHAADIFSVNLASTAALLDWSQRAGVRRFVLASTGGANGVLPSSALSYYVASKRSSELLVQSYAVHFTVTVLRFFFVYGAGQRPSMLIPRLVQSVRERRPITLAGEHGMCLNPIHVDDAVRAIARATELDDSAEFDIAGPEVLTLRAIGDTIGTKLQCTPEYVVIASSHVQDVIGDIAPMSERLVAPRVRFESGVDDVIAAHARPPQ
jgi:UDP-glucose 4-epimerase